MTRAHDPFAAHSSTSGGFPAARLARAGVSDEAAGNLAAWYAERSPEQQAEFRKSINSAADSAIAGRFVVPDGPLDDLLADQLHDLALAAGVPTSGTKAEVIARLQQPQQPPQEPAGQEQAPQEPQEPQQPAQEPQQQPEQPAEAALAAEQPAAESGAAGVPEPIRGEPQTAPEEPAPPARPRRRGGSGQDGQ